MAAANYTLSIEQGVDFELPLVFSNGTVPMVLTGHTFRMQIRDYEGNIIYDATTENGKLLLNVSNSTLTITISNTDSSSFNFDFAKYDLEMVSPTSKVVRIIQGEVNLSKEVTI